MTIKHRFITTYISAIAVTLVSVFLIFSVVSYSTLGKIPSIKKYLQYVNDKPASLRARKAKFSDFVNIGKKFAKSS